MNLDAIFDIPQTTCSAYIQQMTDVLVSLYPKVVCWPDAEERQILSNRFHDRFQLLNCVGIIDGTLLPLATKPSLHGDSYLSRKGNYAVHTLMCCNDVAQVTYVLVGWPGSTHDQRVWRNAAPFRHPTTYFSRDQFLIGDSAFSRSEHMVPSLKKLPGAVLSREGEQFNRTISRARVNIEHCFGMIKTRFQYFRGIRIKIRSRDDLRRIIRLFLAAVVIHNLLNV